MFWRLLACVVGGIAFGTSGIAFAVPVTFYFGGTLNFVSPILTPAISVGDSFHGFLTYESATPDTNPIPTSGNYDPSLVISVTVAGNTFVSSASFDRAILIGDANPGSGYDSLTAYGMEAMGPPVNGESPSILTLLLFDIDGVIFGSDALPLVPPTLGLLESTSFQVFFSPSLASVDGTLTYLSVTNPVPVPSSWVLVLAGLAAVGAAARRRIER